MHSRVLWYLELWVHLEVGYALGMDVMTIKSNKTKLLWSNFTYISDRYMQVKFHEWEKIFSTTRNQKEIRITLCTRFITSHYNYSIISLFNPRRPGRARTLCSVHHTAATTNTHPGGNCKHRTVQLLGYQNYYFNLSGTEMVSRLPKFSAV